MLFWQTWKNAHFGAQAGPFQQGVDARAAGIKAAANPFCVATEAHAEWLEGWRATHDLDEDDDFESCRDRSYCTERY